MHEDSNLSQFGRIWSAGTKNNEESFTAAMVWIVWRHQPNITDFAHSCCHAVTTTICRHDAATQEFATVRPHAVILDTFVICQTQLSSLYVAVVYVNVNEIYVP